jgi:hypothetical protein
MKVYVVIPYYNRKNTIERIVQLRTPFSIEACGYNEVGNELKNITHFENDYDRDKMGPGSELGSAGNRYHEKPRTEN